MKSGSEYICSKNLLPLIIKKSARVVNRGTLTENKTYQYNKKKSKVIYLIIFKELFKNLNHEISIFIQTVKVRMSIQVSM